jgi:hypothetical protein
MFSWARGAIKRVNLEGFMRLEWSEQNVWREALASSLAFLLPFACCLLPFASYALVCSGSKARGNRREAKGKRKARGEGGGSR